MQIIQYNMYKCNKVTEECNTFVSQSQHLTIKNDF
jgi:hypothetical protein